MISPLKTFVLLLAVIPLLWPSLALASSDKEFQSLLDTHWANSVKEKIYFRNDPDAWRMDGTLSEHTANARARRNSFNELMLEQLGNIDIQDLSSANRISYKVFQYERRTEKETFQQLGHYFPITSLFGYHTYFAEAPANMAFLAAEDYDKYLISLADFPRYNNEHIALLDEAVEKGYTHYCKSIEGYQNTIDKHVVEVPENSALFVPFSTYPLTFSDEQKAEYTKQGRALITKSIIPGYQKLSEFFKQRYQPNCRTKLGITELPRGSAYYQSMIRYFTTTDMKPADIHQLGLSEIKRIRGEMDSIIEQVGFDGGFRDFLEFLRTEPKFYAKSIPELLGRAALISKTAEGELPKFFSVLPRGTYKIQQNPSRGTFYMPSAGDGKTSGTYFVDTRQLDSQPFYTLEALTLHEGVPGHHLQSALAMEVGLPAFRRTLYHAAHGEGWGLYSEFLGKEMGFYKDPYSDFGRLGYEAWRAARLVVDTGMHAFGWSRQKALEYMLSNTTASEFEANKEIDRYITWPAQALAYKIGELRIRSLRLDAQKQLGDKFDLRAFHDIVVGNGSLPIAVLEEIVEEWVAAQQHSGGA